MLQSKHSLTSWKIQHTVPWSKHAAELLAMADLQSIQELHQLQDAAPLDMTMKGHLLKDSMWAAMDLILTSMARNLLRNFWSHAILHLYSINKWVYFDLPAYCAIILVKGVAVSHKFGALIFLHTTLSKDAQAFELKLGVA